MFKTKYAAEVGHRTKTLLASLTGNNETRKRKRDAGDDSPRPEEGQSEYGRIEELSWALPLAGAVPYIPTACHRHLLLPDVR